jgi:general secretion pathway protein G
MVKTPTGTITSFGDLDVYKMARKLRREVWTFVQTLPPSERTALAPQMKRAALSITNNLAEGFGRYHYQENIQFCLVARGSSNELLDDFIACLDVGYLTPSTFERYDAMIKELVRKINGYIAAQRRQKASFLGNHQSPVTNQSVAQGGFTFIEIMVVVAILAILAALVVPRVMGRTDEAKRTATKVQIRNIEGALQLYKLDNGIYPSTEQGLKALVEKPTTGIIPKKWKPDGYLAKVPEDPWGNAYKYVSPAPKGDYEITSFGTDGEAGGDGKNADITNFTLDKD